MNRKSFLKNTAAITTGALFFPRGISQYYKNPAAFTPPADLWKMSAMETGELIRLKKVSVREVIESQIERIKKINPSINAITLLLQEEGLKQADICDQFLSKNSFVNPLFGVPFSVKMNADVAGYATTEGVSILKDNIAESDSPHVGFMRKNGSIPLARTNMPDFGLRYHTDNDVYGPTINPWDARLTPGGSSGGDAAAVATGMIPLGLGNDYGGSIRYPAQCCGVCGLRPSRGRVAFSTKSLSMGSVSESLRRFAVQGPIARRVQDLQVALNIMSEYDSRDPGWIPAPYETWLKKKFRVAVITNPADMGVDDSVSDAVKKAATILQNNGAVIEEIDSSALRECAQLWIQVIATDLQQINLNAINKYASAAVRKFTENLINLQSDTTLAHYVECLARINGLEQAWGAFFQKYDLILGPVSSRNPFSVGYDIETPETTKKMLESQALTVSVNLLGLPSVAIPVAVTGGIPQAVQIIGPLYKETRCLSAAQIIENEVGIFSPIDPVKN